MGVIKQRKQFTTHPFSSLSFKEPQHRGEKVFQHVWSVQGWDETGRRRRHFERVICVFHCTHTHTHTHTSTGLEYKSELLVLFLQTELQFVSEEGVCVCVCVFLLLHLSNCCYTLLFMFWFYIQDEISSWDIPISWFRGQKCFDVQAAKSNKSLSNWIKIVQKLS